MNEGTNAMTSISGIENTDGATAREAVALFHDVRSFEEAIDELQSSGFDRAEISLLASEEAVADKLGHHYTRVENLEDNDDVPRTVYVGREGVAQGQAGVIGGLFMLGSLAATGAVVASGGTLAAAALAAATVGGTGGLIGAVFARRFGKRYAGHVDEQLRKGGLLLWVGIRDEAHEHRALEILKKHSGNDVHVHEHHHSHDPESSPMSGLNIDPFLPGAPI